jgi:hypothetical protein
MSLVFVSRPIKTINATSSPWVAAGNPIVYQLQRKDRAFNQINDSSGKIQIQINGVDVSTSFTAGDKLYLQSDNGVYDLVVTVDTVAFSTNTTVTMEENYISSAPGGFVNFLTTRPAYRVNIQLYNSDDEAIGESMVFSPFSNGLINADVSSQVKDLLSPDNDYDFDGAAVQQDTNAHISFYIGVTEQWTGSSEAEVQDDSNIVEAVFGANQIGYQYASNLYEYSVMDDFKFLTKFQNHVIWAGRPFLLSLINLSNTNKIVIVEYENDIVENVSVVDLSVEGLVDISIDILLGDRITIQAASTLSTQQEILNGDFSIDLSNWENFGSGQTWLYKMGGGTSVSLNPNSMYLRQSLSINAGIIRVVCNGQYNNIGTSINRFEIVVFDSSDTAEVIYSFENTGSPSTETFSIDENIIIRSTKTHIGFRTVSVANSDISLDVLLFNVYLSTQESDFISELLTLTVKQPCQNPVQLMWRNSLGGISTFVFDYSQDVSHEFQNEGRFKILRLYTNDLSYQDWDALHEMMGTGEVYKNNIVELTADTNKTHSRVGSQVYMIDAEGNKTGVIVIPTSNDTRTKRKLHLFDVAIQLPQYQET